GGVDPAGQPPDGKVAIRWTETPRSRPNGDLGSPLAEALDRGLRRVRAEQATASRHPALVRIEGSSDLGIEWVGRKKLDTTGDRESEEHRTPDTRARLDESPQLVLGQQVEESRPGDERRAGQVVGVELSDVAESSLDRKVRCISSGIERIEGGQREELCVPVVQAPALRPG